MSNVLAKDGSPLIPGDPGIPATDGGESGHPAYCITTRERVPQYQIVNVPYDSRHFITVEVEQGTPGSVERISTNDGQRHSYLTIANPFFGRAGPISIYVGDATVDTTHCYPATLGVPFPGVPARPSVPANYNFGWTGSAISVANLTGKGTYQFSVPTPCVGVITGLNDRDEGSSYFDIDRGFYFFGNHFKVIENGVYKTSAAYFESADVFQVVMFAGVAHYLQNGSEVYTSLSTTLLTGDLWADCSLYSYNDSITNASLSDTVAAEFRRTVATAAGTLPALTGYARDIASVDARGTLELVGAAASAGYVIHGELPALTGEATGGYGDGTHYQVIRNDVLPALVGYAEANTIAPQYCIANGEFQRIVGFAFAHKGQNAVVQDVLPALTGFATNDDFIPKQHAFQREGVLFELQSEIEVDPYPPVFDPRHLITGNIVLKPLEAAISVVEGGRITGRAQLGRLHSSVRFGMRGAGTLKALTASAAITSQHTIAGAVLLPALTSTGVLHRGGRITGAVKLRRLTSDVRFGMQGAGVLQAFTGAGVLTAIEKISGAGVLAGLKSTGNLSLYGYRITGAVVLPGFVGGTALRGAAVLSGLQAQGYLVDTTAASFEGWALNVRTGGVTRLTNLPFTQLLQVPGGPVLAIGVDGNVYELVGDTDAGAAIPWSLETGLTDFGQAGMKRIPYVYMDALIEGQIQIAVLTDKDANTYTYNYEAVSGAGHRPHKKRLGNAIFTRSIGFRISSTAGGYAEFDAIEPELDVTQRSV